MAACLAKAGDCARQKRRGILRTRCKSWVQDVNINADVDFGIPYPSFQLINHAIDANSVDASGFDDIESASSIVSKIAFATGHGPPDARVDRCISNETLFVGQVKKSAVIDTPS